MNLNKLEVRVFFCLISLQLLHGDIFAQSFQSDNSLRPSDRPLIVPDISTSPAEELSIPEKPSEKLRLQPPETQVSQTTVLEAIHFEGNTIFSGTELQLLAAPYLNKPVTAEEIEALRRLITQHYIDRGYVTSGATFPINPIQGKTLQIKIIEGQIDETRIKGEQWLRKSYIANRLVPDKKMPLNMNELQDRFRILLSDPLFEKLQGRILPGSERGLSILDLEVTRSRSYQISAISDNYRAPSVGGIAIGTNAWIRNLTKQGDILDFTFLTSAATGGNAYQYTGNWLVPIGDFGTKAYFSINNANVAIVEQPLAGINIKSDTFAVEGGLNQTLVESLKRRFTVGAGVGFKDNETNILGESFSFIPGLPSGKNQVSVVRINQEYIERWERLVWAFRSTFSVGLNAFGSTIQNNHLNPDSEYFAWLGQSRGLWNLPQIKSDFVLKGAIQLSNDPLLPLERIAVGGRHTVRGYRENQMVRDNGYAGSAELHIHLIGNTQANFRFDLVPFFDFGAAWNNANSTLARTNTQHIYSAGIGFQFRVHRLSSELYWAQRLEGRSPQLQGDLQDSGVHFQARIDAF